MASRVVRPDFSIEKELLRSGKCLIAGFDEAGRGSLAGPLSVGMVIFSADNILQECNLPLFSTLNDSKKLSPARREALLPQIKDVALCFDCEFASVQEVDRLNVTGATKAAAARLLNRCPLQPDAVLIDGVVHFNIHPAETTVKKGDSVSLTIAAASIVAKVLRDQHLCQLEEQYPGYGFAIHKGYGTAAHLSAIKDFGPSPEHRLSFEPVKSMVLHES